MSASITPYTGKTPVGLALPTVYVNKINGASSSCRSSRLPTHLISSSLLFSCYHGSRLGVVSPLVLCSAVHCHPAGLPGIVLLHHSLPLCRLLCVYETCHGLPSQGSHVAVQCGRVHGNWKGWLLGHNIFMPLVVDFGLKNSGKSFCRY